MLLQKAFAKVLYFKALYKISDYKLTQIISVRYQIVAPILKIEDRP